MIMGVFNFGYKINMYNAFQQLCQHHHLYHNLYPGYNQHPPPHNLHIHHHRHHHHHHHHADNKDPNLK